MSSDDGDGRCIIAMGGGYSGVGRRGGGGGNSRDDFEFYTSLFTGECFFSTSAKEVRVAAF